MQIWSKKYASEKDKIDEHRLNFFFWEIFIVLMSNKKVSHVKPYILYGDDTSDEDPKCKHIKHTQLKPDPFDRHGIFVA